MADAAEVAVDPNDEEEEEEGEEEAVEETPRAASAAGPGEEDEEEEEEDGEGEEEEEEGDEEEDGEEDGEENEEDGEEGEEEEEEEEEQEEEEEEEDEEEDDDEDHPLKEAERAAWADLEEFVESKRVSAADLEGWKVVISDRGGGSHACHYYDRRGRRFSRKREVLSALLKSGVQQRPEEVPPERAFRTAKQRWAKQREKSMPCRVGDTWVEHFGRIAQRPGFFDSDHLHPVGFRGQTVEVVERIGGAAVLTLEIRETPEGSPEFSIEVPQDLEPNAVQVMVTSSTPRGAWAAALPHILREGSPHLVDDPPMTSDGSLKGLISRRNVTEFFDDRVLQLVEGMPGALKAAYAGYLFLQNRGKRPDGDTARRPKAQRSLKQEVKLVHLNWEKRLAPTQKAEFADIRQYLRNERKRSKQAKADAEKAKKAAVRRQHAEEKRVRDDERRRRREEDAADRAQRKVKERTLTQEEKEAKKAVNNAVRSIRRELKLHFKRARIQAAHLVQARFEADAAPMKPALLPEAELLRTTGSAAPPPRGDICGLLGDSAAGRAECAGDVVFEDLLEVCLFLRSCRGVLHLPRAPGLQDLRQALVLLTDAPAPSLDSAAPEETPGAPGRDGGTPEVRNEARVLLDQIFVALVQALKPELLAAFGLQASLAFDPMPANALTWPDLARQIILLHLLKELGYSAGDAAEVLKGPPLASLDPNAHAPPLPHNAAVSKARERMELHFSDSSKWKRLSEREERREAMRTAWREAAAEERTSERLKDSAAALIAAAQRYEVEKAEALRLKEEKRAMVAAAEAASEQKGGDPEEGGEAEAPDEDDDGIGDSDADSEDLESDERTLAMVHEVFQDAGRPPAQRRVAGIFLLLLREPCSEYFLRHPDSYDDNYHDTVAFPTALLSQARAFLAPGIFSGQAADRWLVDAWAGEVRRMVSNTQCYYPVDHALQASATDLRLWFDALLADHLLPYLQPDADVAADLDRLTALVEGRRVDGPTLAASRRAFCDGPAPAFCARVREAGVAYDIHTPLDSGAPGQAFLEAQRAEDMPRLLAILRGMPLAVPPAPGPCVHAFFHTRLWGDAAGMPRTLHPDSSLTLRRVLRRDTEASLFCRTAAALSADRGPPRPKSEPRDAVRALLSLARLALRSPAVSSYYRERQQRAAHARRLAHRAATMASALRAPAAPQSVVRQFCAELKALGGDKAVADFLEAAGIDLDGHEESTHGDDADDDAEDDHDETPMPPSPTPQDPSDPPAPSAPGALSKRRRTKQKPFSYTDNHLLDPEQEQRQARERLLESYLAEETLIGKLNVNLQCRRGEKIEIVSAADPAEPKNPNEPASKSEDGAEPQATQSGSVRVIPPRMTTLGTLPERLLQAMDESCELCGMSMREVGSVLVRGLSIEETHVLTAMQKLRLKALLPGGRHPEAGVRLGKVHRVRLRLEGRVFVNPPPAAPYLPPIGAGSGPGPFSRGEGDFDNLPGPQVHETCALQYLECAAAASQAVTRRFRAAAAEALGKAAGDAGGLPIGTDRLGRQYWTFSGEPDAVFVSHRREASERSEWQVFRGPERIRTLVGWLFPLGEKEGPLREALLETATQLRSAMAERAANAFEAPSPVKGDDASGPAEALSVMLKLEDGPGMELKDRVERTASAPRAEAGATAAPTPAPAESPALAAESGTKSLPDPAPEGMPESSRDPMPNTKPKLEAKPELGSELEPKPDLELEAKLELMPEPKPELEPQPGASVDPGSEAALAPAPAIAAAPWASVEGSFGSGASHAPHASGAQGGVQPETKDEVKPHLPSEPAPAPDAPPVPKPDPEPKPEPEPLLKPLLKPELLPEAKAQLQLVTAKDAGVIPAAEESIEFEIFEGETWGDNGLYTTFDQANYCVEIRDEDGFRLHFAGADDVTPKVELQVLRAGGHARLHHASRSRPDDNGLFRFPTVHPKVAGTFRFVFRATLTSTDLEAAAAPVVLEQEFFTKASSAESLVGNALALSADLRALEILGQPKLIPTRALPDLPMLTPASESAPVEHLKRGLLCVAAALPRGAIRTGGGAHQFGQGFRQTWESHVLSAETPLELAEALVVLEACLEGAWVDPVMMPLLPAAPAILRAASAGAVARRLFALDRSLRYEKLDASSRRRGRSSGAALETTTPSKSKSPHRGGGRTRARAARTFAGDAEDDDENDEEDDDGAASGQSDNRAPQGRRAARAARSAYKEWSSGDEDDEEMDVEDEDPAPAPKKRRKVKARVSGGESDGDNIGNGDSMAYEEGDVDAADVQGDFDLGGWRGRCGFALARLRLQGIAMPFTAPVDLNLYPDYARIVNEPMDLDTVAQRLTNGWYDNEAELVADIEKIRDNCRAYNGTEALISVHAAQLVIKFRRFAGIAG